MRRITWLLILALILPLFSTAKESAKKPATSKPTFKTPLKMSGLSHPRVNILSHYFFVKLSRSLQIEYIRQLRQFVISREEKQAKDGFAQSNSNYWNEFLQTLAFGENAQAAASDLYRYTYPDSYGRCEHFGDHINSNFPGMSTGVKNLIRTGRDKCIVAGIPICMVLTEKGRLSCKPEDIKDRLKDLAEFRNCPAGQIGCSTLFLKKNGEAICVPEGKGSTKRCAEANETDEAQIAEIYKNHGEDFNNMIRPIQAYCGRADMVNYFDKEDCDLLNQRLQKIARQNPNFMKQADETVFDCVLPQQPQLRSSGPITVSIKKSAQGKFLQSLRGKGIRDWHQWDSIGDKSKIPISLNTDKLEGSEYVVDINQILVRRNSRDETWSAESLTPIIESNSTDNKSCDFRYCRYNSGQYDTLKGCPISDSRYEQKLSLRQNAFSYEQAPQSVAEEFLKTLGVQGKLMEWDIYLTEEQECHVTLCTKIPGQPAKKSPTNISDKYTNDTTGTGAGTQ